MFDSLDEQMKHDEREQSTTKERILRYIAIGAASVHPAGNENSALVIQKV